MMKLRKYVVNLDVVVIISGTKKRWKNIRQEIKEIIENQLSRTGNLGDSRASNLVEQYDKETKIKSIRKGKWEWQKR